MAFTEDGGGVVDVGTDGGGGNGIEGRRGGDCNYWSGGAKLVTWIEFDLYASSRSSSGIGS